MDFICILRLSKSQLQENVFKDAVIENIHGALMEYLVVEAHTISFPDLVVPFIIKVSVICIYLKLRSKNKLRTRSMQFIYYYCNCFIIYI